jgi:hypothetical protein
MIVMSSFRNPASAEAASGYTFFIPGFSRDYVVGWRGRAGGVVFRSHLPFIRSY